MVRNVCEVCDCDGAAVPSTRGCATGGLLFHRPGGMASGTQNAGVRAPNRATPIGQMASITSAVRRTVVYSGELHESARSSCR